MSVLDTIKTGLVHGKYESLAPGYVGKALNLAPGGKGDFLAEKVEKYAYATGFGFAKGMWREKTILGGVVPLDLGVGVAATLVGAALSIRSNGYSNLGTHAERLGDAGMMSFFNSLGCGWGAKAAGRTSSDVILGSGPVIGALPAADGAYLTADEIARFAQAR